MDLLGNLSLGFTFKKTQINDVAFPSGQPVHGFPQGNFLHPVFLGTLLIFNLVHHIQRITAIGVDGLVETDRTLDGIQGVGDVFFADADFLGNFHKGWFPGVFAGQAFSGVDGLVGCVPEGAADPDGVVVPQIAPDLAQDHGNRIGRKTDILGNIKIVNGLDQADASDLKQVIHIFIAAGKTLDHT